MRIVNSSGSYDFTYIYQDGQLVARNNPDGTIEYDSSDHLGSVSIITNGTGGVLENTFYSPYGEELSGGDLDVDDTDGVREKFDFWNGHIPRRLLRLGFFIDVEFLTNTILYIV